VVLRHPPLRTIALVNTVQNLGTGVAEAVLLIFAYRSLHLSPGLVGVATAVGSAGYLLGGFLGTQIGLVPTIIAGGTIYLVATLLLLTRSMITLKDYPAPTPAHL
jgi:hypothetical protein